MTDHSICDSCRRNRTRKAKYYDYRTRTMPLSVGFVLFICLSFALPSTAIEMDICKDRSCLPATGNLLIGRENRLSASSTCGFSYPQKFCIVSHLEERKKCFICNSREKYMPHREENRHSHRIENIVTERFEMRNKKWWQSENGVQNVSIRLDLEAEFHFTHLVITFKSFRPAAMLIERSSDFGKTWSPYRYFAYDCLESFPGIPTGPPLNHTDVICTSRYSEVAPSSGGEVVFKALSPHIPLSDPYAPEISKLLMITNLRLNFTKLHTLGDDLLDYRPEIDEKYYYAIYDLVIRGSCSCYGHASKCIPIEGDGIGFINQRNDMVHGQCACTHHTKGRNCEECEDFYNDFPWRPAMDANINECRICNCSQHASRCHFDRAVFEASGFESGGVCDDCQHNTMGKNCEQCKPYYYEDPGRDTTDPYICLACQCDLRGSMNEGICDTETDEARNLEAGRCHCKQNVAGERCDRCKNGFWDLNVEDPIGCKQCTCYLQGTVGNEGCDKYTGECTCKRFVTGENCDKCIENHYGLSDHVDGCKACDCDIGSLSVKCDEYSGQCQCRPHFSGRRCDQPESGYFCANIDYYTYEAEWTTLEGSAEIETREPTADRRATTWTGTGFVKAKENSVIKFKVRNLAQSMDYHLVIRYESQLPAGWQNVQVTVVRPSDPDLNGPCSNAIPRDDFLQTQLGPGGRYAEIHPAICLEAGVQYEIRITLGEYQTGFPDRSATVLIDSLVLSPPTSALSIFDGSPQAEYHRQEYERYQCRHIALSMTYIDDISETCRRYVCSVAAVMINKAESCDCDPTGSKSGICATLAGQCECKENVIGRTCDRCAPGTYGFGPQGCSACDCNSVGSLDNNCDLQTGQCRCREEGVYGRQCDQCQPGFWGFPDCRPCQCNSHADICDQKTGACIECRDLTSGHYCERCQDGYYGDPRLGVDIACRPCPCPGGPVSGYQHADTCYLDPASQNVVCNCKAGYEGERCDQCSMNYWGNPTEVGGSCERCDCHANIDFNVAESCDQTSGECLKCIHNTEGYQCEHCVSGYFGDAKLPLCRQCVCNHLGHNTTAGSCDRVSGQCPCLPNVVGLQCDECLENHWKIASEKGCDACNCDTMGVMNDVNGLPMLQCNEFDGQCPCKQGRGGRTCSECEDYYWGDPRNECQRCQCNPTGSATQQCHRTNGTCVCLPGSGDAKCDQCARGYTGQWPYCQACGECFQNWDRILQELKEKTNRLVDQANNIEDTGVASIYDEDFKEMEKTLEDVSNQLDTANISRQDVEDLRKQISDLEKEIKMAKDKLNVVDERITKSTAKVDTAEAALGALQEEAAKVSKIAEELEENATRLRESDIEGAYNITRESAARSLAAKRRTDTSEGFLTQSESTRREAEQLFERNQVDFEKQFQENQGALEELGLKVDELEAQLPDLNNQVCGAPGDPCDEICGGAGCGLCGGPSCAEGSVTKAQQAVEFAKEASKKLEQKQAEAAELLEKVRNALLDTERAKQSAEEAHEAAKAASQQANHTKAELREMLKKIEDFLKEGGATPPEIRVMAEEVLNTSISLTPEQIRALSEKITINLAKLENIDKILDETRGNLTAAQNLKDKADMAKVRAERILNTTQGVVEALEKAQQAQDKARDAIEKANTAIDTASDDIETIAAETESAEESGKKSNKSLSELETELGEVRVQYLKIDQKVKNAHESADNAVQQAKAADEKRQELKGFFDDAQKVLAEKQGSSEGPKDRAQRLRQQAAKLLERTEKYLMDINKLQVKSGIDDVIAQEAIEDLSALEDRVKGSYDDMLRHITQLDDCECDEAQTVPCPLSPLY